MPRSINTWKDIAPQYWITIRRQCENHKNIQYFHHTSQWVWITGWNTSWCTHCNTSCPSSHTLLCEDCLFLWLWEPRPLTSLTTFFASFFLAYVSYFLSLWPDHFFLLTLHSHWHLELYNMKPFFFLNWDHMCTKHYWASQYQIWPIITQNTPASVSGAAHHFSFVKLKTSATCSELGVYYILYILEDVFSCAHLPPTVCKNEHIVQKTTSVNPSARIMFPFKL